MLQTPERVAYTETQAQENLSKRMRATVSQEVIAVPDDRGVTRVPMSGFVRKWTHYLEETKDGPVELTRNGQPIAVILDYEDYRKLQAHEETAEDLYWTVVALRQDLEWRRAGQPTVSLAEVVSRESDGDSVRPGGGE